MPNLNIFCDKKGIILKDPGECLECTERHKVFEDKGYISCYHARLAENLKLNILVPLSKKPLKTEDFIPGTTTLKILVVRKGGGMGDIITSTVAVRGIREKFTASSIFFHCNEKYKDLLKGNPYIDGIVTKRTKEDCYDLVIELDNACPCYVYEVRNMAKPKAITRPRVDLFCERAGVDPEDKLPFLKVDKKESEWAEEFLRIKKVKESKIALCPTSFEQMKSWPIERVKELVLKLNKKIKATVFILHDKPIEIKDIIGIFGYPLKKVIALVDKMDLVISVDTGFIHMAGALRRPLIGLWGVNEPKRVMAYYENTSWIWKKDEFPCSPCYYTHKCLTFPSPCINAITAKDVFDEVQKHLSHKTT